MSRDKSGRRRNSGRCSRNGLRCGARPSSRPATAAALQREKGRTIGTGSVGATLSGGVLRARASIAMNRARRSSKAADVRPTNLRSARYAATRGEDSMRLWNERRLRALRLLIGWAALSALAVAAQPAKLPKPPGQRGGHLRRRLLLVHGAAVRRADGVIATTSGYTGGTRRIRRTRRSRRAAPGTPKRCRSSTIRRRWLRKAARSLLAQRRPDGEGPPVLRRREPVPHGDLLSRRRAAARSPRRPRRRSRRPSRSRSRSSRRSSWPARSIPPRNTTRTTTRRTRALHVLPHRLRPRRAAQGALG